MGRWNSGRSEGGALPEADVLTTRPFAAVRRFVLLGGTNTVLTFALFTALQHVTEVAVAYTVAFAAGLIFATALTALVVFGVRTTLRRRLTFAGCYLVIYGLGLLVSQLLAQGRPPWLVSAGTIAVTAPLGFLAGRTVFIAPATAPTPPTGPSTKPQPPRGIRRSP
ncbi:MAG: GtrA family protein [Jatrophihabitans sp.]